MPIAAAICSGNPATQADAEAGIAPADFLADQRFHADRDCRAAARRASSGSSPSFAYSAKGAVVGRAGRDDLLGGHPVERRRRADGAPPWRSGAGPPATARLLLGQRRLESRQADGGQRDRRNFSLIMVGLSPRCSVPAGSVVGAGCWRLAGFGRIFVRNPLIWGSEVPVAGPGLVQGAQGIWPTSRSWRGASPGATALFRRALPVAGTWSGRSRGWTAAALVVQFGGGRVREGGRDRWRSTGLPTQSLLVPAGAPTHWHYSGTVDFAVFYLHGGRRRRHDGPERARGVAGRACAASATRWSGLPRCSW
ncbi:MAG: hypothetical protein MZU91_12190 [Desulfosudis oleivorans]|nr:hypothetical protein [Desulfosudis oleivorans]